MFWISDKWAKAQELLGAATRGTHEPTQAEKRSRDRQSWIQILIMFHTVQPKKSYLVSLSLSCPITTVILLSSYESIWHIQHTTQCRASEQYMIQAVTVRVNSSYVCNSVSS